MYDKYFRLNSIATDGSLIPKCKGILINVPSGPVGVTFHFKNISGNTFQAALHFPTGANILPVQAHAIVTTLPSGCTAFYLN